MITRKTYLDAIRPFAGKPVIKAITGIRRCGKSTLILQMIDELKAKGVKKERIIYINKELYEFDEIRSYRDLHDFVTSRSVHVKKPVILFIDEVQEIEGWEKAINSFLAEKKYDIFISGSNARLLSSELATLISGRYVEIRIHTLTFPEFRHLATLDGNFSPDEDIFDFFLKFGGFPGIHIFNRDEMAIGQYLDSVCHTILFKDIVIRYHIRDAALLERIAIYLADNCGNITTSKNISDFLRSQHRKTAVDTVQNYIQYCIHSLLVEKVRRFDLKGKRILETHEKYYLRDTGLRYALIGYSPDNLPGQLENIIFLDLIAHGYQLFIGKQKDKEIDFIARKGNDRLYIQVCTSLADDRVVDREYGSLETIRDHFPKYVLSLDKGFETSRKGIRWMNIRDFLLDANK
jgi:predicted AAA+ superfamily ATPase